MITSPNFQFVLKETDKVTEISKEILEKLKAALPVEANGKIQHEIGAAFGVLFGGR